MSTSFRRIAAGCALAAAVLVAYLCLWPVPARPVAWTAQAPPGYTGAHAANERLAGLRSIPIEPEFGPEHVAFGPDGRLYAAMTSGALLRMDADGGGREVVANTGGRVLGFDFDAHGVLFAADAMKGLLAVSPDGRVRLLADRVGPDDRIRYANSLVVAPDGTVYFTDASTRFAPADWGGTYPASLLDIIEQAATGRVLAYDPATTQLRVVARGFSFANGIAMSSDGRTLFVSETGRYRIWKVDGAARGLDVRTGSPQATVLLDNLPGYPDNLMRGRDGRVWVGLFGPRNPAADALAGRPFLRTVLLRLPRWLLPVGKPYGHVFAFDESGRVVEDLQDPSGAYPATTGATETADRLYVQSLHARTLGWLPRPAAAGSAGPPLEDVHVVRSIRERRPPDPGFCAEARTGVAPLAADGERWFSFWSVRSDPSSGRVVDAAAARVGELRGCLRPTEERARQRFDAEIQLGGPPFHGSGECVALNVDFPEKGLVPVRCHLVLSGLPAPFVGGTLTTNTLTSTAPFGGETEPSGYTQASIATVRLWRARP